MSVRLTDESNVSIGLSTTGEPSGRDVTGKNNRTTNDEWVLVVGSVTSVKGHVEWLSCLPGRG